ncbi:M23 family metallopeptidase [Microbacterium lacticum]
MLRKLLVLTLALVFLGPSAALVGLGVLMNPATIAACRTGTLAIGSIPESLTATTKAGQTVTLSRTQLTHAATIITVGAQTSGVGRAGIVVALMAALTESSLRMLANTSAYPESAKYPNDGTGSDHDSLGLFQMRPVSGWGSVAHLMDPTYQARAFYGGPTGPNYPSPRGLLDIPGWQHLGPGAAAQAVEVSAYPDRYQNYQPVAETILATLTTPANTGGAATGTAIPETSRILFPLPSGTWVKASPFGWRTDPFTGQRALHTGTDYAAADGTPILAIADGVVTIAGPASGYGNLIVIEHTIAGQKVASAYAHMWDNGIHVAVGDQVRAGQHIADVGSAGRSTGPHLHFEIRPGGTHATAIDSDTWLTQHTATSVDSEQTPQPGCASGGNAAPPAPFPGGNPDALVDDPTTSGRITARMAYVMAQAKQAFPDTGWACWSPRPGTKSEHPLGRACDVTFGNHIGQAAKGASLEAGWAMAHWLQTNADTLGIQYLIWQGKAWTRARSDAGWRPYDGGGMHDPTSITGGHYDHVHITVKAGA